MMEGLLSGSGKSLMPGFRFHPTDEELFMYYLKRKVLGKTFKSEMMAEVDVYRFAPWELPEMSLLKTKDLSWYFFCPRGKKYPNGGRANRATVYGYWKSTGNDRSVTYNSKIVGRIKTLIFHRGKAPKGERTNWVMHEYRLEHSVVADSGVSCDSYVICKIYEKSGWGPKNGENYGARFVEEEWETDDESDIAQSGASGLALQDLGCGDVGGSHGSGLVVTSGTSIVAPIVSTPTTTAPPLVSTAPPMVSTPATIAPLAFGAANATVGSVICPLYTTTTPASALNATPDSVSARNAAPAFSDNEISQLLASEAEIDRLLACFTEDHSADVVDIYEGLENLDRFPALTNIAWSDLCIEMDDLVQ